MKTQRSAAHVTEQSLSDVPRPTADTETLPILASGLVAVRLHRAVAGHIARLDGPQDVQAAFRMPKDEIDQGSARTPAHTRSSGGGVTMSYRPRSVCLWASTVRMTKHTSCKGTVVI